MKEIHATCALSTSVVWKTTFKIPRVNLHVVKSTFRNHKVSRERHLDLKMRLKLPESCRQCDSARQNQRLR